MDAVAYLRVSTTRQKDEGVSLAVQESRIRAWCVANDCNLVAVYSETLSGARADNRPEVQKAIAHACKARGVLVVYSLSRLARSITDALTISDRLDRAHANLASLSERLDTTSAVGRMVFRMLSTLAAFEREQLGERVEAAMSHLRRANRRISNKVPFGYDLCDDGTTLVVNQAEWAVLESLSLMRANGASYGQIAGRLNLDGVKTKEGKEWFKATVKRALDRKAKLVPLAA